MSWIRLAIALAISAALLFAVARGVDAERIWQQMRDAHVGWLVVIGALVVYSNWVRAQRWRHFFGGAPAATAPRLFSSMLVGFAANALLPFRLGEVAKAYSAHRNTAVPLATCVTTVVLERLFDLVAVLALIGLTVLLVPIPEEAGARVDQALRLFGAVTIAAALGVALLLFARDRALRWLATLLSPLPERWSAGLLELARSATEGLTSLGDARRLVWVLVHTAWLWIVLSAVFGLGALAVGIHDLPLATLSLVTSTFVAIFVMIPAAPGFVGTYQAGVVLGFSLFGVPKSEALGLSLLVHAASFIPSTVAGIIAATREGLSLGDLRRRNLGDVPFP